MIPAHWRRLNDQLKAFILALAILILLHLFVVRWVTVQSTSMYATLLPGDLLLVQRWKAWTGLQRGDIVVFRDPLRDRDPMRQRPLLVKRIAGMPGDRVRLKGGDLFVNGVHMPAPPQATTAHLLRLRDDVPVDSILARFSLPLPVTGTGRRMLEVPLNDELAQALEQLPGVVSATELSAASGSPRHIFPYSPFYKWNSDDYGPIQVPRKGDTLRLTARELPLYDRLISRYEGHELSNSGDTIYLDGKVLEYYVVEQDHYFMLGDSRHHSADSRYWGFVPEDHLLGRVALVLLSKGTNGWRRERFLTRP